MRFETVIYIETKIGEFVVLNRINEKPAVLNTGRSENLRQSSEIIYHLLNCNVPTGGRLYQKKFPRQRFEP